MLFVSHPVADIIDECLTIKIIIINSISEYSKMTPKMWFRDYAKVWRRQDLDEQIMRPFLF